MSLGTLEAARASPPAGLGQGLQRHPVLSPSLLRSQVLPEELGRAKAEPLCVYPWPPRLERPAGLGPAQTALAGAQLPAGWRAEAGRGQRSPQQHTEK